MRILLAEDEKELSNALSVILKHNHYSVDTVYNGTDALSYLETGNYDGVILDIMMPGMDGIQVLKTIRTKGNMVPVLILTAKSEVDDCVLGLDSGADDYLSKPFSTKELLARLRAITRRKTELSHFILQYGNVSLDSKRFELSTPSGTLRLPNKEFQMFEMLMANPGHIFSAEQFLEKIWDYDSETEIRVVWVYISYLRKKLNLLQADITITSARNQGYFLEAHHDKSS